MFDQTSRYYNLKNLTYVNKRKKMDKQFITYKERRFLPSIQNEMTKLQDMTTTLAIVLITLLFVLQAIPSYSGVSVMPTMPCIQLN